MQIYVHMGGPERGLEGRQPRAPFS